MHDFHLHNPEAMDKKGYMDSIANAGASDQVSSF